jgi:hypothetical protein
MAKNNKHPAKKMKSRSRSKAKSKTNSQPIVKTRLKWLVIIGYLLYILLIFLSQLPLLAEFFTNQALIDNDEIEYHLSFNTNGRQSHYYIERANQSKPGRIDVYYYPDSNTLKTEVENIKILTIFARSMYYDECKDVYGIDPDDNSNYYKWYFIEKNHLNVNIDSDSDIETLRFVDVPKPYAVYVDGIQWTESNEYYYAADSGVALSNVSSGTTNVDLYFKSPPTGAPVAKIEPIRKVVQVDDLIKLNGSASYDTNPTGYITNYIWDFGEGNFTSGQDESVVTHSYTSPGVFGVILTVVDDELNIAQDYLNITVVVESDVAILGKVPDVILHEDAGTYNLKLRDFEPYSNDPGEEYFWYLTDEDTSLYSISGENSAEDRLLINPMPNMFGDDEVILWLVDSHGIKVSQVLWINITPVNDPPTIFGIPDITIHYDVPYEFYYLPYIDDVDTPLRDLQINSSDTEHTSVRGFNVSYEYPKSYLGKTEYVILTLWDGQRESSDVVAVWITDDWVPNLVTPLPDVYLNEGEVHKNYFDLDDYFMDPDNDTLYYSYGYTHVHVVINPDHTVDFYAPDNWNGQEMTTFRATDPSGALVEDIITVVVRPVNDPPIIENVPNLIIRYDQDYIFDVSPYISDEDTPISDLVLTTSDPSHIRLLRNSHLTIILNYPYKPEIPYTQTVTLTVSDGLNSTFQIITVFVKDNYPPVLAKQFKEIVLFEDVPRFNVLNFYEYFEDEDSTMLYFKVLNNENIIGQINVNGSLDLSSTPNWSGKEKITFRALDPDLAFVESIIEVIVLPVNDAPVLAEIPIQRFNSSEKYKLSLNFYISDVDNNLTQLKLRLENCKIDYEIHGTDIIFYATEPDTTTVTLYVSDGDEEVSQKILLQVSGKEKEDLTMLYELIGLVIVILVLLFGIAAFIFRNYIGTYKISEMFLIFHNGCMIMHQSAQKVSREETDADIISAMFTAVQDFTRDSFSNIEAQDENWSLKKLEFKNNNILIERGDFVYLAVIFTGRPGKKLGLTLRQIRTEIEETYYAKLKIWGGDMDELDGIDDIVEKYSLISNTKSTSQLMVVDTADAANNKHKNVHEHENDLELEIMDNDELEQKYKQRKKHDQKLRLKVKNKQPRIKSQ